MKRIVLFILTGMIFMWGCDDSDTKIYYIAYADSYVKTKKIDNKEQYGVVFVSHVNPFAIKESYVVDSDDKRTNLEHYWASLDYQRYMPGNEKYSENLPDFGNYKFVIRLNSKDSVVMTDSLHKDHLGLLNITEGEYAAIDHKITLKWDAVPKADNYIVKVTKEENSEPLYYDEYVENTEHTFTIDSDKWYVYKKSKFYELESFNVEVMAIKYGRTENGAIDKFNVRALSTAIKTFTKASN